MLRVCLIGCGSISTLHLDALQRNSDVAQVVGLVDPVRESAAKLKEKVLRPEQCQIYNCVDDMNESLSYDAAVIMVPHDLHVEIAKKCINAGKHVLLEKPVSNTLSGCEELLRISETTDRVLMIAENARYWPEVVHAKRLIEEGAIGTVYFGQTNYFESYGWNDFQGTPPNSGWLVDKDRVGGGVLMCGTVHWIRGLRVLLGDITEVIGFTASPWQNCSGESLTHSLLKFSSGLPGVLHTHTNEIPMGKLPFFQIFGTKGEIAIHGDFNGGLTVYNDVNPSGKVIKSLGGYRGAFPPQMNEFISRALEGKILLKSDGGSVWEGCKDILVSMATYKSSVSRKWESTDFENCKIKL